MEGLAHDERAGAGQRGVSAADQNPGLAPNEEAVLLLLFGLLRSGQVKLRRLVGWHDLTALSERPEAA